MDSIIRKAKRSWHLGNRESTFAALSRLSKVEDENLLALRQPITESSLMALLCAMLSSHTLDLQRVRGVWQLVIVVHTADSWPQTLNLRVLFEIMTNLSRLQEWIEAKEIFEYWLSSVPDKRLEFVLKHEKKWLDDVTECYLVKVLAIGMDDIQGARDFIFFNVYLGNTVKKRITTRLDEVTNGRQLMDSAIFMNEDAAGEQTISATSTPRSMTVDSWTPGSSNFNSNTADKKNNQRNQQKWILIWKYLAKHKKQILVTMMIVYALRTLYRRYSKRYYANMMRAKVRDFIEALVNTNGF